jgi:hypothetical protein
MEGDTGSQSGGLKKTKLESLMRSVVQTVWIVTGNTSSATHFPNGLAPAARRIMHSNNGQCTVYCIL